MKKLILVVVAISIIAMSGVAMAADTALVQVSASVTGTCKFLTGGSVAFGALDPASGADMTTPTISQPTFWCTKSSSYTITDDKGENESGNTFRLKHASLLEYIPYTFTYTALGNGGGKGSTLTMNIASTITGTDYINASAGNYADKVTLTISP